MEMEGGRRVMEGLMGILMVRRRMREGGRWDSRDREVLWATKGKVRRRNA